LTDFLMSILPVYGLLCALAGAACCWTFMRQARPAPAPAVPTVEIDAAQLAKALVDAGFTATVRPRIEVDWHLVARVAEAEGMMLVRKAEPREGRAH